MLQITLKEGGGALINKTTLVWGRLSEEGRLLEKGRYIESSFFGRDGSARITYQLITDCSQHNMASSSPSVVTVSKGGQVSTSSTSGTAVVMVTVQEQFGINQTTVVYVEVNSWLCIITCFQAFPVTSGISIYGVYIP